MPLIISPENCEYRGEGGDALVISLKKEEKVLRLIKYDDDSKHVKSLEELQKQLEDEICMIKYVLKPLLGKTLVNCPALVLLEAEDVKILSDVVSLCRPKHRIHKNIKEGKHFAVLLPDYCTIPPDLKTFPSFGSVIGIEIKPKPGFLLKDSLVANISERSVLMCHFCRKQVYKLKKEGVSPKSAYCPTDLFSGCPIRMKHALKMLLETPQNNIRIFKDGKLVYSEENRNDIEQVLFDFFDRAESRCDDALCKLIIEVLLKSFPCKSEEIISFSDKCDILTCANAYPSCNSSENDFCHTLTPNCVLHRILRVQKLDKLDIQTTYSLLNKIKSYGKESSNHIGCYLRSEIPPHLGEKDKAVNESDYQYASRKVWEFSVALIAKDCSIMLVLQNYAGSVDTQNPNLISDAYGKKYLFSAAVVDLGNKPLNRIEKHYKRAPLWLQSCLSLPV